MLSGIKEIKAVMADAERNRRVGRRTLIFIDEIHRFNKAQQDAFLPYVERGDISLIGATTENPSFEVISALLSRTKVYMLKPLTEEEILGLLERALPVVKIGAPDDLLRQIATYANGDARTALNILELAAAAAQDGQLTREAIEDTLQRKTLLYDKAGEEHFNLISALHKSVRSSDVDAALYWLGRMLEAGEDRMYIARRLVRMAIEDIGLADPRALEQSIAAMQTVHFLGIPEGDLALAQVAIYLSVAPKSDASYQALNRVMEAVEKRVAEPVPFHLAKRSHRRHETVGLWGRVPARAQAGRRPAGHGVPAGIPCRHKILRADQARAGAAHRGTSGRDPRPQKEAGHPIKPAQVTLPQGTTTFKRSTTLKLGRIRYRSTRAAIAI